MKKTFLLLIAFCISVLAIHACKKTPAPEPDNPWGLPNATQEGKNIFACRVNGENWIVTKGFRTLGGGWTRDRMHVSGVFRKTEFSYDDFIINIYGNTIADKIYFLNDTVNQYVKYLSSNDVCFEIKPESSIVNIKSYDGELILTKVDTIKRILSGTFWFNILTDHCDTMKVTDGRFDIRYN